MNNNFPLIVSEIRKHLGVKEREHNETILYNGKKGALFAFTKQYDDGLEVLCLHGKLKNDFSVEGLPVSSDDKWVLAFAVNTRVQISEKEILRSEVRNGDAVVMYNQHYGFNIQLKADELFFIISIRFQQKSLGDIKQLIDSEQTGFIQETKSFLFLKAYISPEIRSIITQIVTHRNMGAALLDSYFYAKSLELSILYVYDISVGNSKAMANFDYKMKMAQKARDIILTDLSLHYSIANIAKQLLVSETVLKEAFVNVFGIPIYSFYQEKRLEESKGLLNAPSISVTEVAYKLGFSSPSNFIKFFKGKTGMSPAQYQKK